MADETINDVENALSALDAAVKGMLAEDLPLQRQRIRDALQDGKLGIAKQEVHAVRGSAAFCGLACLSASAASLENALQNDEKNAELIRAFESDMERVLHGLEKT